MKKLTLPAATIISSSLLLILSVPALASTVEVAGNGASSDNSADVSVSHETSINQSNAASASNSVYTVALTGNNTASKNTDGDLTIKTGDSNSNISATTNLNTSSASLACCDPSGIDAKISGNGADSRNTLTLNFTNTKNILDQKTMNINNDFSVDATTGKNTADKNTGGDTTISTGDSNVNVTINNSGNVNKIVIGSMLPVVTPPVVVINNPVPTLPTPNVLGATTLPVTGFNFSYLTMAILAILAVGAFLRTKTGELEAFLTGSVTKLS